MRKGLTPWPCRFRRCSSAIRMAGTGVFRGRRGSLIKVPWHDGQGLRVFSKRFERARKLLKLEAAQGI